MVTPPHIVPEWYFLPFYAILRSITFDVLGIPGKLIGVVLMFGAVLILFLVPWLDTSPVRSARFRPIYRIISWFLVIDAIVLGYVGSQLPQGCDRHDRTDRHRLLFHPLPDPDAADRQARDGRGRCRSASAAAVLGPGAARPAQPRRRRESDMRTFAIAALVASLALIGGAAPGARAGRERRSRRSQHWSFDGVFGTYDRAALQRGFQVYKEVCSACHHAASTCISAI